MGVIFDTSVLIAAEKKQLAWEEFLVSLGNEPLFIAAITLSELWHGCHRATGPVLQNRLRFVNGIESMLPVLEFSATEALVHAKIWVHLEATGQRIGPHDLLIAATALSCGFSLATLNGKEFKRISSLELIPLDPFVRS